MKPFGDRPPDLVSTVIGAVCGYEAVAVFSGGRLLTITELHRRHEAVGVLVLGWLVAHFLHAVREELEGVLTDEARAAAWKEEHRREQIAESAAERAVTRARHLGLLHR